MNKYKSNSSASLLPSDGLELRLETLQHKFLPTFNLNAT